jgi:hypothetical protein
MRSPFPGMDPYLEEPNLWPDVHLTLIIAMRGELNTALPPGFVARADTHVWVHEPDAAARARPNGMQAGVQQEGNRYLKILELKSNHIITVVELLTPANKHPGLDREAYLTTRGDVLNSGINLVELDLLRGGQRMALNGKLPRFDYCALVSRATRRPAADFFVFTIRDQLPVVPVPLVPGEADVPLSLGKCLNRVVEQSRYELTVNDQLPPDPPLSLADAEWAKSLLEKQLGS